MGFDILHETIKQPKMRISYHYGFSKLMQATGTTNTNEILLLQVYLTSLIAELPNRVLGKH